MPLPEAEYVVVGLTNGPGFTANPCLADQVGWIRRAAPARRGVRRRQPADAAALAEHGGRGPFDAATELGALANTGYQQALANVATMRAPAWSARSCGWTSSTCPTSSGAATSRPTGPWSRARPGGTPTPGYEVGVYSTPHLWRDVVGDLALGLPEWRAAGQTSQAEALSRCGEDWQIQGGAAVLGQWVQGERDLDVTCPGVTDLGRWFQQY